MAIILFVNRTGRLTPATLSHRLGIHNHKTFAMLQKIMIENQSKVAEIKEKVERAIEKAGYNVTVNWNGTLSYNNEHSYNHQQEVYEAYAEILEEYKA